MIPLSVKNFADFMTSSPTKQRAILREIKYPPDEISPKVHYYQPARQTILDFHKHKDDITSLLSEARRLATLGALEVGPKKSKLLNNSRVLRSYARYFGDKQLELLPDISLTLTLGEVRISVIPELHAFEKKKEKIIKLVFNKQEPTPQFFKIVGQAMFEAQEQARLKLPSASVLCYDVARGGVVKGARVGSRLRADMENTCRTIEDIWIGL
jgi:hypothetical protein